MKRSAAIVAALAGLWPSVAIGQRATFQGMGQLPGGTESAAVGISADGRVVVGSAFGGDLSWRAVRWTTAGGLEVIGPPDSGARAASADGSLVVVNHGGRAFRWSQALGLVDLGDVTGGAGTMHAGGISQDGLIIAGTGVIGPEGIAFRWTEATGPQPLFDPHQRASAGPISGDGETIGGFFPWPVEQGFLWTAEGAPQLLGEGNIPLAISTDGSVAVGAGDPIGCCSFAFRWTAAGGLEFVAGAYSAAYAVSADGSIVVGNDDQHSTEGFAFTWERSTGLREVRNVLIRDYGLDLTGWELWDAYGVSADGTVIVGGGRNPAGEEEGWVARLGNGPCYADCDASGEIDFFDFLCFQDAFAAAEPWADCDGSGALDFSDFLCFQNAFAAGCD